MPEIHWAISLGDLIMVATMIVGFVSFITTTTKRLDVVEKDLAALSGAMITIARQDERLKALEENIRRRELV